MYICCDGNCNARTSLIRTYLYGECFALLILLVFLFESLVLEGACIGHYREVLVCFDSRLRELVPTLGYMIPVEL